MAKEKVKKEKKLTMKEKILRFVEERGTARFTDIQRFIVDERSGPGTYDSGKRLETVYIYNKELHRSVPVKRMLNIYRGIYCSAFNWYNGYLRTGKDYLDKKDKLYYTVRNGEKKVTSFKSRRTRGARYMYKPEDTVLGTRSRSTYETEEVPKAVEEIVADVELNDDVIFFHSSKPDPISNDNKYADVRREVPGYCRWCGHELDPSHFRADDNGMSPSYCQWCSHEL